MVWEKSEWGSCLKSVSEKNVGLPKRMNNSWRPEANE